MRSTLVSVFLLVFGMQLFANQGEGKISTEDYINQWKATAINNMQEYGIPASIILAQGILESASGNSRLATKAKNHFGIKCHDWKGKKIYHDDDRKGECFRVYDSAEESFRDHGEFLKGKSRYAFLFEYKSDDYKAWAKGLKKAGYATNPKYPQLLIGIIERYDLAKYDSGKTFDKPSEKPKKIKEEEEPAVPREFDESIPGQVITLSRNPKMGVNKIKTLQAKAGDSPEKIAEDLDMAIWQIAKYNNVEENYKFAEGEVIFLQPKRRKNCKLKTYVVGNGEGLRGVSQTVGVKMKHILRLNALESPQQITDGQTLQLCKKK